MFSIRDVQAYVTEAGVGVLYAVLQGEIHMVIMDDLSRNQGGDAVVPAVYGPTTSSCHCCLRLLRSDRFRTCSFQVQEEENGIGLGDSHWKGGRRSRRGVVVCRPPSVRAGAGSGGARPAASRSMCVFRRTVRARRAKLILLPAADGAGGAGSGVDGVCVASTDRRWTVFHLPSTPGVTAAVGSGTSGGIRELEGVVVGLKAQEAAQWASGHRGAHVGDDALMQ